TANEYTVILRSDPNPTFTEQVGYILTCLKSLRHQHLVELTGSFHAGRDAGFILSPAAEYTLSDYLFSSKTSPKLEKPPLRQFFGCLATLLAFLLEHDYRLVTFRPDNILVFRADFALVDIRPSWFFYSYALPGDDDFDGSGDPEEMEFIPRMVLNRSAWSLGDLFLWMICSLTGKPMHEPKQILKHGQSSNSSRLQREEWMDKLEQEAS